MAGAMTFGQGADMYIAAHEASWRNSKHRQQWHNTLCDCVRPPCTNDKGRHTP
jgi:hypothetical protein